MWPSRCSVLSRVAFPNDKLIKFGRAYRICMYEDDEKIPRTGDIVIKFYVDVQKHVFGRVCAGFEGYAVVERSQNGVLYTLNVNRALKSPN